MATIRKVIIRMNVVLHPLSGERGARAADRRPPVAEFDPLAAIVEAEYERVRGWLMPHCREHVRLFRHPGCDCWLVLAAQRRNDQGEFYDFAPCVGYVPWQHTSLHRVIYEMVRGPVPEGYHLHHICRVQGCFNPFHLIALSPEDHEAVHNDLRYWFDYGYEGRSYNRAAKETAYFHPLFTWQAELEPAS